MNVLSKTHLEHEVLCKMKGGNFIVITSVSFTISTLLTTNEERPLERSWEISYRFISDEKKTIA